MINAAEKFSKSLVHYSLGGGFRLCPDWPGPWLGLGGEEEGDQERQEPKTGDKEPSLSGQGFSTMKEVYI